MAKKSASSVPQKLHGKSIFLGGRYWGPENPWTDLIALEGGTLADELTDKVDYLLLGGTATASPQKTAMNLNAQGASIQVMMLHDFEQFMMPTSEEGEAMLHGGEIDRWNRRIRGRWHRFPWTRSRPMPIFVRDADFRGAKLTGALLTGFENCDFRDADLSKCTLGLMKCDISGAKLDGSTVEELAECQAAGLDFRKCEQFGYFDKSNLAGGNFAKRVGHGEFVECNLDGADFSRTQYNVTVFRGCSLEGADFSGSRLPQADFEAANLRNARFTDADLNSAKIVDATVDGADFTGATLLAADLTNVDFSKAKGYDPAGAKPQGSAGAAVAAYLAEANQAQNMITGLGVTRGSETATLEMRIYSGHGTCSDDKGAVFYASPSPPRTATDIWSILVAKWQGAVPDLSKLSVRASKANVGRKEMMSLALAAWCELFGIAVPTEADIKQAARTSKAKKSETADEWIGVLKSGTKGIERWNADADGHSKSLAKVADVDLAGANLAGLSLSGVEWKNAKFQKANLAGSDLAGCRFPGGDFSWAKFRKATVRNDVFLEAKLTGADFTEVDLSWTALKRADCTGAIFAKAKFDHADLCGADFTGADLSDAVLDNASYDEHTRWPKKFKPTLEMIWKGPGTSPAAHALVQSTKPKGKLDLDQFMKRLEELTDKAKLDKALKMLKADRFRLYAQVADDHFVGVVKSQGDPDLVYSCRLNSDGTYACCTQNLNVCGGLRGSLCKHLLVLIVGLSKGGDLDPNAIDTWIRLSKTNKPALDKDRMSETFLRYKGAEAGEVDWRPTETIPEDYYAM